MRLEELRRGQVFSFLNSSHALREVGLLWEHRWVKMPGSLARLIGNGYGVSLPPDLLVTTTFFPELCDECSGRGYVLARDPAMRAHVVACQACRCLSNDWLAARLASADGVLCRESSAPYLLINMARSMEIFNSLASTRQPVRPLEMDDEIPEVNAAYLQRRRDRLAAKVSHASLDAEVPRVVKQSVVRLRNLEFDDDEEDL